MFTIIILFLVLVVHLAAENAIDWPYDKTIQSRAVRNSIVQQDFEQAPPFPILAVGLQHIVSDLAANGTEIEIESITDGQQDQASSPEANLLASVAPKQCGLNSPCFDGSCCNTLGQCGFTDDHCKVTASASCILNCGATAMCGINSINSQQRCPLGLCCSYSGYCGTTELYCNNLDPIKLTKPCQQGFGNCRIVQPPSCGNAVSVTPTASKGRRIAYYQAGNVRWRQCNRISPSQINTTGLTHLNFAFASIDPVTFKVVPIDSDDLKLYSQFTALKSSKLETWIAVGGFGFSDPGPTHTTWSDVCSTQSNRSSFIASLIEFMNKWGFQGVDIDWEFPGVSDRGGKEMDTWNLVLLVREMRAAFGSQYGISIALPNDFYYLERFDPVAMEPWLTFINFMTYDMHGPWEAERLGAKIRPQTSITDIQKVSTPLWFAGLSPPKINLGIAYYGRGYTVSKLNCVDIGCPYVATSLPGRCTSSPGVLSLTEIDEIIRQKNLVPKLIPESMIKQITFEDQWIGYDDDETIALKFRWADQHCLGGVAIWSIDFNSGSGSNQATPPIPSACSAASSPTTPLPSKLGVSKDGSCGGQTTCQGSAFGNCCSSHGFCGSTELYCATGCQSGFGTCTGSAQSTVSLSGLCGGAQNITCKGSKFGDCCSRYGYCGSTGAYCDAAKGCQCKFGTCQ